MVAAKCAVAASLLEPVLASGCNVDSARNTAECSNDGWSWPEKQHCLKPDPQNKMITPVLGQCLLCEISDEARAHHVEQNDHLLPGAVQLPAQNPQVPRQ